MSNAAWMFSSLVFVGIVTVAALFVLSRAPRKRKTTDELEAAYAALRLRLTDLEDKHEHHVKREAVRIGREKREDAADAQGRLPLAVGSGNRADDLARVRSLARERGLI